VGYTLRSGQRGKVGECSGVELLATESGCFLDAVDLNILTKCRAFVRGSGKSPLAAALSVHGKYRYIKMPAFSGLPKRYNRLQ